MKNYPTHINEIRTSIQEALTRHHHGLGLAILVGTLLFLSILSGLNLTGQIKILQIGDIAESNVIAQRNLIVQDPVATQLKRDQEAKLQPRVYDLSVADIASMRSHVFEIITRINETDTNARESLQESISTQLGKTVDAATLSILAQPYVQEYILNTAIPWLENQLREGIVGDAREALSSKHGIVIRDLENESETEHPRDYTLRDIPSLLAAFNHRMRTNYSLSSQAKRAIYNTIAPLVMPTLTPNKKATLDRQEESSHNIEPVFYNIQQGEVVIHKGERVTREIHLKLEKLYQQRQGLFSSRSIAGTFVFSLLFSVGLFMAPSGKPGTPLRRKDFIFISVLLLLFGLAAKGSLLIMGKLVAPQDISLYIHLFPIAGAAGLGALIFAARRYCVLGFLLSLFGCAMLQAGLPLFLYFFLSAMLNTWLVIRAQSRQDVVTSFVPLAIGMVIISLGSGWMQGFRGGEQFIYLGGIAVVNAFVSILLLFALSPIIEQIFRYTTRFRLMELMNLEQPLLQDLMVAIPGTYHHSLVVSNMVEAGAKDVGANGLLCKVGALYHDIGKLAYPDYYIENQFGGPNRHDKLAPSMSALILTSHVKKGIELAEEYHLGDEIRDIIAQHHGTSLIKYFYAKAEKMGEKPRREDYCYDGPRPQTREAAIVMLADVVEASSRTMADPTPARIRNHVNTMLKNIFTEGQLDESELTFKDLFKLEETFSRILTGMFHQRIAYPETNKKGTEKKNDANENQRAKIQAASSPLPAPDNTASGKTKEKEQICTPDDTDLSESRTNTDDSQS